MFGTALLVLGALATSAAAPRTGLTAVEIALAEAEAERALARDAHASSMAMAMLEDVAARERFAPQVSGQLQVNLIWNHRPGEVDEHRAGVQLRRTKLRVSGHVDDVGYVVGGGFERSGGTFEISDAYLSLRPGDAGTIRLGRFRPWLLREQIVSAKRQLLVDRSPLTTAFGLGRDAGVDWRFVARRYRVAASFTTDVGQLTGGRDDWTATLRGDWLVTGSWRALRDFTSAPGAEDTVMFGAGVARLENDDRTWRVTADATYEFAGGQVHIMYAADAGGDPDPWAVRAAGSVYVTTDTELVATVLFGDDDVAGRDALTIVTGGLVHYVSGHALRLTTDVGYAFDPVGGLWASSGTGWVETSERGEIVARAQLQLLF